MKKILLIIGILVILGAVFLLLFRGGATTENGDSRVGFSIREFFPFGRGGEDGNISTQNNNVQNGDENGFQSAPIDAPIPRLRKISREPVAGAVIYNTGTTSVVRFVEKGTGNVYETKSNTNSVNRLTNTTIPKILKAIWLKDGSGFLSQTILPDTDIVETSFVKIERVGDSITENLTPYNTTISRLPTDIEDITISPNSNKIFYYTKNRGYSSWYISNPDGTESELVNTHNVTEWITRWLTNNTIALQTKASYMAPSYNYTFNIDNKQLKKEGFGGFGFVGNFSGDGSYTLASNGGSFPNLFLVNNATYEIFNSEIISLSEKCVWTKNSSPELYCAMPINLPSGNYPDAWYKGVVNTEDTLIKLNILNDVYSNVVSLSDESNEVIDVVDIMISQDDSHIIFRNKIDGFLWLLRI